MSFSSVDLISRCITWHNSTLRTSILLVDLQLLVKNHLTSIGVACVQPIESHSRCFLSRLVFARNQYIGKVVTMLDGHRSYTLAKIPP